MLYMQCNSCCKECLWITLHIYLSWIFWYSELQNGRQTLFRQTLFQQTLFRQSAVRTTQYIFSTLDICRNSRNWEQIGMGRGVGCIESMALIEALRWLRGAEPGEGIPVGLGSPLLRKSYNVLPTQLYCPWFSGIGSASFQSVPGACPEICFFWGV